jgi:hypothetical protein
MVKKKRSSIPTEIVRFHAKGVARIWRNAIADSQSIPLVFSPYLTSSTAETVLGEVGWCEIHLLFKAELFASGASSLLTLKKLSAARHGLFHVPDLHAKVVIDEDNFVSIGSQNLTWGGTRNREITVTLGDAASARAVSELVAPWLTDRVPITDEMIADMEELVRPLKKVFARAQAMAAKAQLEFDDALARRELAERLRAAEAADRASRLAEMRVSLTKRRQSVDTVFLTVVQQSRGNRVHSCVVETDADLTSWTVDGTFYSLQPLHRYLCILEDTGWIGWARVGRSRITYVSDAIAHDDEGLNVNGLWLTFRFYAERSIDPPYGRNVLIKLVHCKRTICEICAWYQPGSLEVLDVMPSATSLVSVQQADAIGDWIRENRTAFAKHLLPLFVSPFKYLANLTGAQADDFFGSEGTLVNLRLVVEQGYPVLVG